MGRVKQISFIFIGVLLIHSALAKAPTFEAYRSALDQKLSAVVALWNGAKTYQSLVESLPLPSKEKAQLQKVLLQKGLRRQDPPSLDYDARRRVFTLWDQPQKIQIQIVGISPALFFYGGRRVVELKLNTTLPIFLKNFAEAPGAGPSSSSRWKFYWDALVPVAEASLWTKEFSQKILMIAAGSFAGFWIGGNLWSSYSHFIDPSYGAEGREKRLRDRAEAKDRFPEIEKQLVPNGGSVVRYFDCKEPDRSSALEKVTFSVDSGTKELALDLTSDESTETTKISSLTAEYKKHLEDLRFCCAHFPCAQWLAQRIIGEPVDLQSPKTPTPGKQAQ